MDFTNQCVTKSKINRLFTYDVGSRMKEDIIGIKKGPRTTHEESIRSAINSGNIGDLITILERSSGPRKTSWALETLEKSSFQQYMEFNTLIIGSDPIARKNPMAYYLLSQELLARAILNDFEKATTIMSKYPSKKIVQALREMALMVGSEPISFVENSNHAKILFSNYHELHDKVVNSLASLAAISAQDSRWSKKLDEKYLRSVFEGRYRVFTPDKFETSIRNAITHLDFEPKNDGRFCIEDRKGKKRFIKPQRLDTELNHMMNRMRLVHFGISLPTTNIYQIYGIFNKINEKEGQE